MPRNRVISSCFEGACGIGGIKSIPGKHEFLLVRSLKICTILGVKWGVTLVKKWPFLTLFGLFWAVLGCFGLFWAVLRVFWGHFGVFWGCFGVFGTVG